MYVQAQDHKKCNSLLTFDGSTAYDNILIHKASLLMVMPLQINRGPVEQLMEQSDSRSKVMEMVSRRQSWELVPVGFQQWLFLKREWSTIMHAKSAQPEWGTLHAILKGLGSLPSSGSCFHFLLWQNLGGNSRLAHPAESLPLKCKTHDEFLSSSLGLTKPSPGYLRDWTSRWEEFLCLFLPLKYLFRL